MKIRFYGKEVALVICFVFLFSALAFAQGKKVVSVVGDVMDLDIAKKKVVVNEKTFVWGPNTLFYDAKGSPVTADKLRKNVEVSIEATWVKNKPYTITKIYISLK